MYSRIRLLIWGATAIFATACLAFALRVSLLERDAALQEAKRETEALALAVSEHFGSGVRGVDVLLQDLADEIADAGGVGRYAPGALRKRLALHAARVSEIGDIVVYDADLEVHAHTFPAQGARVPGGAERRHVTVHRRESSLGLYVGEAMIGPFSGTNLIPVTRRLARPDGRFDGVIGASLPLAPIETYFRRLGLERDAGLLLLRDDGAVLLQQPRGLHLGENLGSSAFFRRLGSSGESATLMDDVPGRDGPQLTVTMRAAGLPVQVVLARDVDTLLALWRRGLWGRGAFLALLLAASGGLAFGGLAYLKARLVAEAELREAHEALRERDARLGAFFRAGPVAHSIVREADNRIIEVNDAWERTFGHAREAAIGRTPLELGLWQTPDDRERFFATVAGSGRPHAATVRQRRGNGEAFDAWLSARRASLGGVPHLMVSTIDVSAEARAREALKKSEERFARFFRVSPTPLVLTELASGICLDANEAAEALFGYARAEVVGSAQVVQDVWPEPAERERYARELQANGRVRDFEARLRRRSGAALACSVFAEQLEVDGVPCVLAAVLDVTERRNAERALRESEARFQRLFRSSPVAHSLLRNADGRYAEVNDAWTRTFGFTREEAVGRTSVELGVWVDADDQRAFVERLAGRVYVRGERGRRRRRNGDLFEAVISAEIIELDGVHYRLTSVLDVTVETRALESLRESETRFAALFHSSATPTALIDVDADRYVDVNGAWERTFRRERAAVVDRAPDAVGLWPDRCLRAAFVSEVLARGGVRDFAATLRDGAGAPIEARVSSALIELNGRRHLVTTSTDVTPLARAIGEVRVLNQTLERRVRERTHELEAANQELEAFSYSVAHDLRAPLRAVVGFAEIVQSEHAAQLDAEGRRLLGRVGGAARQLGALIDALLGLSRLVRQPLSRATVDVSALAAEALEALREGGPPRSAATRIEPGLSASADPVLAKAVLANLLGNAWKYTANRAMTQIEVGRQGEEFFVRDNGAGFDMRYSAKLFRPFERLHGTDEFPGTGIGLATVARIVRRHGGTVRAESAPGEGATFFFSFGPGA